MQNSSFPKQLEGRGCGSIRSVSFSTKTWNIEHKKRVKNPPPHPDRGSRQSCAWSTAKFIHYFKRQNPSFFKHNSSLSMQNSSSFTRLRQLHGRDGRICGPTRSPIRVDRFRVHLLPVILQNRHFSIGNQHSENRKSGFHNRKSGFLHDISCFPKLTEWKSWQF